MKKFFLNKYFLSFLITAVIALVVLYFYSNKSVEIFTGKSEVVLIDSKEGIPVLINSSHQYAKQFIAQKTFDTHLNPVLDRIIESGYNVVEIEPDFALQTIYTALIAGAEGRVDVFTANKSSALAIKYSALINELPQINIFQNIIYSESAWLNIKGFTSDFKPIITMEKSSDTFRVSAINLDRKYANSRVDTLIIHPSCHMLEILQGSKRVIENNPNLSIILRQNCASGDFNLLKVYLNDMEDIGFEFFRINYDGSLSPFEPTKLQKTDKVDILITRRTL